MSLESFRYETQNVDLLSTGCMSTISLMFGNLPFKMMSVFFIAKLFWCFTVWEQKNISGRFVNIQLPPFQLSRLIMHTVRPLICCLHSEKCTCLWRFTSTLYSQITLLTVPRRKKKCIRYLQGGRCASPHSSDGSAIDSPSSPVRHLPHPASPLHCPSPSPTSPISNLHTPQSRKHPNTLPSPLKAGKLSLAFSRVKTESIVHSHQQGCPVPQAHWHQHQSASTQIPCAVHPPRPPSNKKQHWTQTLGTYIPTSKA